MSALQLQYLISYVSWLQILNLTLICRALSKKFMPGILSFLGPLCCSCFEKFTFFFNFSRRWTNFFEAKIIFFKKVLPPVLMGGKVIFEKFFSTKMKKKFSTNLLNKINKSFLKFWVLLDKHFSEKQKSHRQGWRKNWFSKSGQGSCSKIFFSLKKSKYFQRQEIKILEIFLKNFLKIKIFQN